MRPDQRQVTLSRRSQALIVPLIALLSVVAGSLLTARIMHANAVRAESNRVFELMIYHTEPGKVVA